MEKTSSSNYVKKIESNVKGMQDLGSLALGEKTLIIGPNGAGKSAVTNAVELALAARASDIAGRVEVKAEAILLSLAPGGHPPLYARATFADGKTATFEIPTGGAAGASRAKRAKHDGPGPDALPLLPIKEALTGSADAARAWFLSRLNVSRETILALLPAGQGLEAAWKEATASCSINDSPTSKLLAALAVGRKKARDAGSEARAAVKVTAAAAQGLPPPPAEGELAGAREALQKLEAAAADGRARQAAVREAEAAASGRETAKATMARNAEALIAAKAEAAAAQSAVEAAVAALPPAPPEVALRPPESEAAIVLIRHHFRSGATLCYACNRPLDAAEVVRRAAWLEERLGALKATEEKNAAIRATRAAADEKLKELRQALRAAEKQVTALAALAEPTAAEPPPPPPPAAPSAAEMAQLDLDIATARRRVEELVAAQAAWETSTRQRDVGLEAGRQKQVWAEFVAVLEGIVAKLLDAGVARFVTEVRRWLPEGDLFDVELHDGDKEVCRWGLRSDAGAHLRTALSGVEWARVTMALTLAASPQGAGAAGALRVVIPEDRAWDPRTLTRVLEVLVAAPDQILLASPIEPETVPAGWTVVRVAPAAQTARSAPAPTAQTVIEAVEGAVEAVAKATMAKPPVPKAAKRGITL